MGFFDKISNAFSDETNCAACGKEMGTFGKNSIADGKICSDCCDKLSPFFHDRETATAQQIKEQLEYREKNKEAAAAFVITRTFGQGSKKLYINDNTGTFAVSGSSDLAANNADIIPLKTITSVQVDIDEDKRELRYRDKENHTKSFSPRLYTCSYDFNIIINVNNPYFKRISFQANGSSVKRTDLPDQFRCNEDGSAPMLGYPFGPGVTADAMIVKSLPEFYNANVLAEQIKSALTGQPMPQMNPPMMAGNPLAGAGMAMNGMGGAAAAVGAVLGAIGAMNQMPNNGMNPQMMNNQMGMMNGQMNPQMMNGQMGMMNGQMNQPMMNNQMGMMNGQMNPQMMNGQMGMMNGQMNPQMMNGQTGMMNGQMNPQMMNNQTGMMNGQANQPMMNAQMGAGRTVTCPACGAATTPVNGRCQYCNSELPNNL